MSILLGTPKILQHFLQIIFRRFSMTTSQRKYVKAFICGLLLNAKISMHSVGESLAEFQRDKSSVSRMMRNKFFETDRLAWESALMLIEKTFNKLQQSKKYRNRPWILIMDTTHRQRFGKLLENLIKYKGEKSISGTYAFLWPLLIAPDGTRISFPPPIWYSPDFAKKYGFKRRTQPQMAVAFLRLLSGRMKAINCKKKLIVLADSAFENKEMWKICRRLDWTLITPCKEGRCIGSQDEKVSAICGEKVHDAMKEIPSKKEMIHMSKVINICLRSMQKSRNNGKTSHWYAYYKKQLTVAHVGTLSVVRSHKLKHQRQNIGSAPHKILLCNDLSLSCKEIIALYAERWQCETFFREHKSHLHFNDFQARCFYACWRFVALLCVTFNFLEFFRHELIDKPDYSLFDCHGNLENMRTSDLKALFQRHASADSLKWLLKRLQTPFGLRRIKQAIDNLCLPFSDFQLFSKINK